MLSRRIDDTKFLIAFRNKDGEEVTIDPNGGFDVILKHNYANRVLHNCYLTLTQVNEPGFPYEIHSINGETIARIPQMSISNYSFDIYPSYCQDVAVVPEPKKETDNVEEPVIDETEKLHNNLVIKLEVK